MPRYLLDTNTCIAVMRNHPLAIGRMSALLPGECAISTITAYELYTGVEKCAKPEKERAKVELLLKTVLVIAFDSEAAKEAARIRALLEAQGQIIGPYDLLLAGQALFADYGKRKYERILPGAGFATGRLAYLSRPDLLDKHS